jgi:hypothetical protein
VGNGEVIAESGATGAARAGIIFWGKNGGKNRYPERKPRRAAQVPADIFFGPIAWPNRSWHQPGGGCQDVIGPGPSVFLDSSGYEDTTMNRKK